jgi:hypothetical protein
MQNAPATFCGPLQAIAADRGADQINPGWRLQFRADGSAGLKGFQVPLLKGFDQVAIPAFMVLLGEGKQAHQNQSRQDTSGYDVLHHGCHSTGRPRGQR